MRRADRVVATGVLVLGLGFLVPVRALCQDNKDTRLKCSNNLKMIGLASLQYCDDKRFFQHIGKSEDLDNAGDTCPKKNDVPPRCLRALVFYNYLDAPEAFVCPAAPDDEAKKLSKTAKEDLRQFGWLGSTPEDTTTSPIVKAAKKDKDAEALTDLSYGWTLRGYGANSNASSMLAADRARRAGPRKNQKIKGNHKKGYTVIHVDCHSSFVKATDDDADILASIKGKKPALVVWDETTAGEPFVEEKDEKKDDAKPDDKKPEDKKDDKGDKKDDKDKKDEKDK